MKCPHVRLFILRPSTICWAKVAPRHDQAVTKVVASQLKTPPKMTTTLTSRALSAGAADGKKKTKFANAMSK